jgi:hypothetical protein
MLFATITPFLLFTAFLLLLLITLSAPIVRSIYLFKIASNIEIDWLATNATGTVRFGVFGYCVSPVHET